ncbi:MAG: mitofilin family membrane protein [Phenylobacterium sp.]
MSPVSDRSEITAPKDPAQYRPRRMLGFSFWAAVVFGLVCVLAGAAIGVGIPRLLQARPVPRTEAVAPAAESARPAPIAAVTPAPPVQTAEAAPPAEISRLDTRVAALESHETRSTQAAAAALAAAAVVEASQGSGPFAGELAALRAAAPPSPELAALSRLAETGAPSRAALAASYPDYAARAASAARAPGEGAGLGDRIIYVLSKIVMLRRVGDAPGDGADAHLARAERMVEDGDLEKALRALDQLPPEAREAMAPWRARAERRAEIDRQAAALRTHALQDLVGAVRSGA